MDDWYVYEIDPIDFHWGYLKTVSETAREIGSEEATIKALKGQHFYVEMAVQDFLANWESAKVAVKEKGWDSGFRQEPVVFWVPYQNAFECGFVIKQDSDGTTFVVSPVRMPWFEEN